MPKEDEKKKTKKIDKPKTDVEAMPKEMMEDPLPEEEFLLPSHLSMYTVPGAMPLGAVIDPLPVEKPTYTPSGDIPPYSETK